LTFESQLCGFQSDFRLGDSTASYEWRQTNDCGPVSALVFSAILNKPISYSRIEPVIRSNERLDITQISSILKRFGVGNAIIFKPSGNLISNAPLIVHLESSDGFGHYVVLHSVHGNTARIFDGLIVQEVPLDGLMSHMSGYAIEYRPRLFDSRIFLMLLIALNLFMAILVWYFNYIRFCLFFYGVSITGLSCWPLFSTIRIEDKTAMQSFETNFAISVRPFSATTYCSIPCQRLANDQALQAFLGKQVEIQSGVSNFAHFIRLSAVLDSSLNLKTDIHKMFSNRIGSKEFYLRNSVGVGHRVTQNDIHTFNHRDYAIALAGECQLSSDYVIDLGANGSSSIEDLLRSTVYWFDTHGESEFSVIALTYYVAPVRNNIVNRFGRKITFDDMARLMMKRAEQTGSCYGTHSLYALALLWQANQKHGILTASVQTDMEEFFIVRAASLEAGQSPSGAYVLADANKRNFPEYDRMGEIGTLFVTGHHLEWQARLPERLRASDRSLCAASLWGLHHLGRFDETDILYPPISHLARAVFFLSQQSKNATKE